MRLNQRVVSLVLGILLIAMIFLAIPLYWYTRDALEDELGDQLKRISYIIRNNLDQEMVGMLVLEPELVNIRNRLEKELTKFSAPGLEGLTVYRLDGLILAQDKSLKANISRISPLLPGLLSLDKGLDAVVSEIYELEDGRFIKAAAIPIQNELGSQAVLVIWTGVSYMAVIKQLTGSLFWIMLAAIVTAVSLTLIFTRSLIQPVVALSQYAKSIQLNINSKPVQLGRSDEFGDLNQSLIDMHQEIQKQEESARQLLSGIAHEIKNPLGGMEIYSGLLQEELSASSMNDNFAEHRSYLAKINTELQHLKQIVQEYLDYARPLKSKIEDLQVEEIFENIHAIMGPEMSNLGQNLTLSGDAKLKADRSKLQRVFLNLLQNGLQSAGENGAAGVTVHHKEKLVQLDFHDNGSGIPEPDWQHIFEPYFSTRDRGFGLGLTIVKSIVGELGGTIVVKSSDETGTVFQVLLPMKEIKA